MSKQKISEVVKSGRILVSDGAWGTFLHKKGLKPGDCPEIWNIERFDDVKDIADSYISCRCRHGRNKQFRWHMYKL